MASTKIYKEFTKRRYEKYKTTYNLQPASRALAIFVQNKRKEALTIKRQELNGKTLRLIRVTQNVTQPELAEKVGVSTGLISAMENGNKSISYKVEPKLREVFGVTDEDLNDLIEVTDRIQKD